MVLSYVLYYIYIYALGGMLKVLCTLTSSIDFIGQLIMYVLNIVFIYYMLNIYILHIYYVLNIYPLQTVELLCTYCNHRAYYK